MALTQADLEQAERRAATLVESWQQGDKAVRHSVDAALKQVDFIRQQLAAQQVTATGGRRLRVTYAAVSRG